MENKIKKSDLFNVEAEQIVLGTIIINNKYFFNICDFLKKEYFYEPAHQIIFEHIKKSIQETQIIADSITLKNFFDNDELLKTIGGSKYLSILLSIGAGIVDIVDYAKMIQDLALKRKLVFISEEIITNAYKNSTTVIASKQIEIAINKIFEIQDYYNKSKTTHIVNDFAEEIHKQNLCLEDTNYKYNDLIKTNIRNFDSKHKGVGGFHKKELVILAGRPSMGKSSFAIHTTIKLIKNDYVVLFFSLEMSKQEIVQKILSNQGKIDSSEIKYRNLKKEDFNINLKNADILSQKKLYIDDNPAIDTNYITNCCKRVLQKEKKIDLVIVDHIQIMNCCKKNLQRYLELGEITMNLKRIAKDFNCCVLALSQLSRGIDNRDNKIPNLEDLRESGRIEENANMVIFIYREIYYLRWQLDNLDTKDPEKFRIRKSILEGKIRERELWCDLFVKKNRGGRVAKIELSFQPEYSFFDDREKKEQKTWKNNRRINDN